MATTHNLKPKSDNLNEIKSDSKLLTRNKIALRGATVLTAWSGIAAAWTATHIPHLIEGGSLHVLLRVTEIGLATGMTVGACSYLYLMQRKR